MATTAREIKEPTGRKVHVGKKRALGKGLPFRMTWGALFAGTFAALGVWIVLYALGVAIGLTAVNPGDPSSLRASGIFTGVWSLVTPLIALFIGGWIAARSTGPNSRLGGGVHGLVVWSITAVAGVWLVADLFGGVVGSAASMTRTAASAAQAIGQGDTAAAQQQGQTGVRELAQNAQKQLPGAGQVGETAAEAAPETGVAFGIASAALLLGLLASVLGGYTGVTREQRRLAEEMGIIPVSGLGEEKEADRRRRLGLQPGESESVVAGPGRARPTTTHDPEMDELRHELAQLRTEVREALVRTEQMRH